MFRELFQTTSLWATPPTGQVPFGHLELNAVDLTLSAGPGTAEAPSPVTQESLRWISTRRSRTLAVFNAVSQRCLKLSGEVEALIRADEPLPG